MIKAKKLPHPKVWLVFDDEGRLTDWANHRLGIAKSEERVYAYTPAKPAKVCVWVVPVGTVGGMSVATGCDAAVAYRSDYKFCPYCGGKIRVKR